MSSFEQPILQVEVELAQAELDLENISKKWRVAATFPDSYTADRMSITLSAAIQLVGYRRKALKRAKKTAGNVSDQFSTMSAADPEDADGNEGTERE